MTETLNRSNIIEVLKELLLEVSDEDVLPSGDFESLELITDFDLDSLQRIELILNAEQRFDMDIDDDEFANFSIVSQLVDGLCQQLKVF